MLTSTITYYSNESLLLFYYYYSWLLLSALLIYVKGGWHGITFTTVPDFPPPRQWEQRSEHNGDKATLEIFVRRYAKPTKKNSGSIENNTSVTASSKTKTKLESSLACWSSSCCALGWGSRLEKFMENMGWGCEPVRLVRALILVQWGLRLTPNRTCLSAPLSINQVCVWHFGNHHHPQNLPTCVLPI